VQGCELNLYQKRPIEKARIKRILIRATNWVGDAVMTLPALDAVRENFPGAHITVLAKPWVAPIFQNHPAVDHVLVYDKGNTAKAAFVEMFRITRLIREERFDLAILFQNAFEAALLAFVGRVKQRVGYRTDGRGFMLTHGVPRSEQVLEHSSGGVLLCDFACHGLARRREGSGTSYQR
jgi:heptosyltransferase-2